MWLRQQSAAPHVKRRVAALGSSHVGLGSTPGIGSSPNAALDCQRFVRFEARRSIGDFEGGRIFWPMTPMVIDARGRDVRVPEPFLHLRDVGFMVERVGRGGRAQAMHAEAIDRDPSFRRVRKDHLVHPVRRDRVTGAAACALKQRGVRLLAVTGGLEVRVHAFGAARMQRQVARLIALAMHPQVRHAATRVKVAHGQPAQLLTAQPVIQQHRQQRAIAQPFQRGWIRRVKQGAGLMIAERRRPAPRGGRPSGASRPGPD
jgi:hypothetical protein